MVGRSLVGMAEAEAAHHSGEPVGMRQHEGRGHLRTIDIYETDKMKEKQQTGIQVLKFSANAFLGGLFLTTERG